MSRLSSRVGRYRAHLLLTLACAAFAALFLAVALSGFHQPAPHGLTLAVAAPAPAAHSIADALDAHAPGAFRLRAVPSAGQARAAVAHRRADGAIVVSGGHIRLLTAVAGGTAPAQAILGALTPLSERLGRTPALTDVVPARPSDTQALSSFFLALCVLFPSLAGGVAAGHVLRAGPLRARIAVLGALAALAGLVAAAIGDAISGLGHFWSIAGVVALFSLAISAPTAALGQIRPHLAGLCVVAFLVFGIPVSGGPANLAAFGPGFLRALHGGLPLGIAADTIRNTVYFGAADTAGHVIVLAAYAAGGLSLLGGLVARSRRSVRPVVGSLA